MVRAKNNMIKNKQNGRKKRNYKNIKPKLSQQSNKSNTQLKNNHKEMKTKIEEVKHLAKVAKSTKSSVQETKHYSNKVKDNSIGKRRTDTGGNRLPVSKELLEKFSRGSGLKGTGVKTNLEKIKLLKKEKVVKWTAEQSARTTILLTEDPG